MAEVVAIAVTFPEKRGSAYATSPHAKRPRATIVMTLDSKREITYTVPVRVARLFAQDEPELPCLFEHARALLLGLEERTCMTALIEMLSRRDHSIDEASRKLSLAGYFPSSVESAITRAQSYGYLNDVTFAQRFVSSRKARGWGRRKIEQELRHKGVDVDSIPGYPDDFFSVDDEVERARAVLARKRIPETRAFEKLVKHLMGKGFSYGAASDAVKERLANDADQLL